jgi:anthranilate phosphoribosyltransferase
MLKKLIEKIKQGKHLSEDEAAEFIDLAESNEVSTDQIADFLLSLKEKGETLEEITGFARRMREKALKINTSNYNNIVDSCGTGGDKTNTFNISTACAVVAAAAGVNVAKHSNYGFTSKSGSSNVLEALGIKLLQSPDAAEQSLKNHNIAFIHAPYFHKCTANVNSVRKKLGIRTVFNIVGPLTNPAFPYGQVMGVANITLCSKIAEVLKNLDTKKALVVSGINPSIDEVSICGKTFVSELNNGIITNYEITPEDFGLRTAKLEDIQGDTPEVNAKIITDIFAGKITDAKLDVVLLNTAALLWTANAANSLQDGVNLARSIIKEGKAFDKLKSLSQE